MKNFYVGKYSIDDEVVLVSNISNTEVNFTADYRLALSFCSFLQAKSFARLLNDKYGKRMNDFYIIELNISKRHFSDMEEYSEDKQFLIQDIESVIKNSVSDYDCLVEKLQEMMYPEEFEKMKLESDKNV